MKNLFVPYELAKLAKEKGFAEQCIAVYSEAEQEPLIHKHPHNCINGPLLHPAAITAPTWQQLVDWFRDMHNLIITVFPKYLDDGQTLSYTFMVTRFGDGVWEGGGMKYYHEAHTAALTKAFEILSSLYQPSQS